MISISRIFLCDGIFDAQYGKLNIIGYIPTNRVFISDIPYAFQSTIVIEGLLKEGFHNTVLTLTITLNDSQNNELEKMPFSLNLNSEASSLERDIPLLLQLPIDWDILDYNSTLNILIDSDNNEIYKEIFIFLQGDAPCVAINGINPSSSILGNNSSSISFEDIVPRATKEIIIIDQYLEPSYLRSILPLIKSGVQINLIVAPKLKQEYQKLLNNLCKSSSSLEVRFSRTFHDRFVIINDAEFYHFGHSLKDINGNRISRYSKIINQEEIDRLKQEISSNWVVAETL